MLFVDMTSQPRDRLPDSVNADEIFDPYTTYNLNHIRGGYKQLTNVKRCLDVNFNSLQVTQISLWKCFAFDFECITIYMVILKRMGSANQFNSLLFCFQNIEHLLSGHRDVIDLTTERSGHCDAVAVW